MNFTQAHGEHLDPDLHDTPKRSAGRLPFFNNCVNWNPEDVDEPGGLIEMIDRAQSITRRTFLKHVDRLELRNIEQSLGYMPHSGTPGMWMSDDWHVSYHRSKLHGKTVYYFRHSAIEYVFA